MISNSKNQMEETFNKLNGSFMEIFGNLSDAPNTSRDVERTGDKTGRTYHHQDSENMR